MADFKVRIRGYSRRQVDELEERIERSLAGSGEMTADDLRAEMDQGLFDIVIRGYDADQVHTALQEWILRLEGLN
ncbi:hypothetical protein [Nonomuraea zeae]|uniref:DivIVA domain-containing protein n=1 Tax=Nonomuraea zeae TaxID=1642303 RepID=A0A5S4EXG0_9ACTN|nr:hypothetical protein [Nonomuraea zeae]TMR08179.1 hypothetical protein ETD85_62445 [Nonomuraea zeae]